MTTVGFKKPGAMVNIETDMIGKYVERFIAEKPDHGSPVRSRLTDSGIDMAFLSKNPDLSGDPLDDNFLFTGV